MVRHGHGTIRVGIVSLRRKKRRKDVRPIWFADFTVAGKRHRKSLKCTDKQIAIEKALDLSRKIERGEYAAENKVVERQAQTTVREFVAIFWARHRAWSESTVERYRYSIERYVREEHGDRMLGSITALDIEEYLSNCRDRGCKPNSINRYLQQVRTIYRCAVDWGYLLNSPAAALKYTKAPDHIPDALTDAEVNALMQQLSPYNRLIVSTLVETGMRWGELASLQWGDVDLADQHLIIRKDKDNTFRVLPLTTRATESLRQLHSLGQIPFVCRPDSIRKGLRDAAGRAEIKHVHPHMLRHTFATRLRDRGVPLDRIMELLGHKTMAMTLRYAKARPEQLREAIRALEG